MMGLGGVNPAKMEKMLKKLNIDMRQLPATEVIIKGESHEIVITEPEVSVVKMQGRDVFQITGNIEEKANEGTKEKEVAVNEDDVKMIMEQTGKDKESVETALKKVNHDLAKAIMELKKEE